MRRSIPLVLLCVALLFGAPGASAAVEGKPPKPRPAKPKPRPAKPSPKPAPATGGGSGSGSAPTFDPTDLRQYWSHGTCTGSGPVMLGAPPLRLGDIAMILPLGLLVFNHVTPIDHQYYEPANRSLGRSRYDVLAPAKGAIVSIQTRPNGPNHDYRVAIEHSCTFWTYYDLMTELSPKVLQAAGWTPQSTGTVQVRIPVEEGEVIGKVGGQTLDIGVVNSEVTLPGLLVPSHYTALEPWKIHTVDPFDYFKEPLRSRLLALDVRTVEPRGGKIDYDVDGRLVGNWFLQGTNGYRGTCDPRSSPSGCSYWVGHLAVVYDAYDPTQIRVSIGDFAGQPRQFGVVGNGPDPASVSVATGLVKYELVQYMYYKPNGELWSGRELASGLVSRNGSQTFGVVLLQLIGPRSLKVEAFPGKTAAEVSGFDGAAKLYER